MKFKNHINKFKIFIIIIFILLHSVVIADTDKSKINTKIVKINYIGNKNISNKNLNNILGLRFNQTKKYKNEFNERSIKLEKEKIKFLYISKGFINCKINDSIYVDLDNKLNINYNIEEGEKYILKKISINGNKVLKTNKILALLNLEFNSGFNIFIFQERLDLLENKYKELGYVYVDISYTMNDNSDLEITINVDEGEKYYINKINIDGFEKVKQKTIKKQIDIKLGDVYNLEKIKKSRKQIIELGVFNGVNIVTENRNIDSQYVDLNVKVSEALEHRWDINLGFKQGRVEFVNHSYIFSKIDWSHRNVFRKAHRLSISSSVNLLLNQIPDINDIQFSYDMQLSYRVPILLKYHLPSMVSLYQKKDVYSPFNKVQIAENDELITRGLSIFSNYKPNRKFQISVGYTLREIESILSQENAEIQNQVSFIIQYDNRDNFLFPNDGWNIRTYTNYVNSFKENYSKYIQWEINVSKYIPIFRQTVIASRISIGEVHNFAEHDPLTALFRLGTETSVRGWDQSIGNKYLTADSLAIYAGYSKMLANIEYRFPLFWSLGAVFFVDAGQLKNNFKESIKFDEVYISAGFGIRLNSPVGPIRFEMPFVINDPSVKNNFGKQTEIKYIIAILFPF